MRVRVVVCVALILVGGTLLLDMSGSAPRLAGSNHTSTPVFAATVPGGGELCQSGPRLAADASRAQLLIGTYGRPVPALGLRFLDSSGTQVAAGRLRAGAAGEGLVTIPLDHTRRAPSATTFCLRVGGGSSVVLGGEAGPVNTDSELVDGKPQGGRVGLLYLRSGSESWWQLLPVLDERIGLGKSPWFGDWTLPVLALLLLGVWVGTLRLLLRELT